MLNATGGNTGCRVRAGRARSQSAKPAKMSRTRPG
jgi:hypothetical protein